VTVYVDTSALAKWYLNEPQSEKFESFITAAADAAISRLTVVEFRCLLARRRRAGDITAAQETRIADAFAADVAGGAHTVHAIEDGDFGSAVILITELRNSRCEPLTPSILRSCAACVSGSSRRPTA
jgi:uncharacterized protein